MGRVDSEDIAEVQIGKLSEKFRKRVVPLVLCTELDKGILVFYSQQVGDTASIRLFDSSQDDHDHLESASQSDPVINQRELSSTAD